MRFVFGAIFAATLTAWTTPASAATGSSHLPGTTSEITQQLEMVFGSTDAAPLRCATETLIAYENVRSTLDVTTQNHLDHLIQPRANVAKDASTYLTPEGHFEITYELTGVDAVSDHDAKPSNGVPDYVELIGEYLETAWSVQIDTLELPAPPVDEAPYAVSFRAMSSYGYTTTNDPGPAGTRIVLHNTFIGFPANEDPDGDRLGSAKATVAHEFKHASQHAGSRWSEGSWLELDATWVEDVVFDDVNDYYQFLEFNGPIGSPTASMHDGGGGRYEDCIWQHFLEQRFGTQLVVDVWLRRVDKTSENVLMSYDEVLRTRGSSVETVWAEFVSWNYATGDRAVPGFGYEEAASYPMAPIHYDLENLPNSFTGTVDPLAAAFLFHPSFSAQEGTVEIEFESPQPLQFSAVVHTPTGTIETFKFDDGPVSLSLANIQTMGLVVSNAASEGEPAVWTMQVRENIPPRIAALSLDAASFDLSVAAGGQGSADFRITNTGEAGSQLEFEVVAMEELPPEFLPSVTANKSIEGSTLETLQNRYHAGSQSSFDLVVTNASGDEEWLTLVELQLPPGVTMVGATNFVGGTAGELEVQTTSDNVVRWLDPTPPFGNVFGDGAQATASVTLAFDAAIQGTLIVDYTLMGDGWMAYPHEVKDQLTLNQASTELTIEGPTSNYLALGDRARVSWEASPDVSLVSLEFSGDDGATWNLLTQSNDSTGSFEWTVQGSPTRFGRFRVNETLGGLTSSTQRAIWIYRRPTWAANTAVTGTVAAASTQAVAVEVDARDLTEGTSTSAKIVVASNAPNQPVAILDLLVRVEATEVPPVPNSSVTQLRPNFPNPFNPETTIRFSLARAGSATLRIVDLKGRHVATLVREDLGAGDHSVQWFGQDDRGRAVASGIYVYRLESAAGEVATRSMTLVR